MACFCVHSLTNAVSHIVVAMTASLVPFGTVKKECVSSDFERKVTDKRKVTDVFSRGKTGWILSEVIRVGDSDHSTPRLMPSCS